ncbi:GNAT family N-acetyltransferase [Providencia sp. PROV182]|uniref:GNAT family N-acetyltransferase n=1 Tax=Providencia sp. PROV182 TaxID=2949885 RepID=UPI00234BD1E4|nr:GNAT family N-acetyltransferase [Providencia sp. PROV182]
MIVQSATRAHDDDIIRVWESSVRATHHFLTEEKIAELKIAIKDIYLPHLAVFVTFDSAGNMTGFLGYDKHRLEMLFISQENRGQGTGKKLLQYAIDTLGITELDVNEQNPQAIGFYQHMGFKQYARSELDGEGNPFPILHMRLNKESA